MALVCLSVCLFYFSLSLLFSAHLELQGLSLEAAGSERLATTVRSVVSWNYEGWFDERFYC